VDTSWLAPTRARPGPVATNERAEEELCLIVYPEQPASLNRSRCWNWFRAAHQVRDAGEPSLIAGITRADGLGPRHPRLRRAPNDRGIEQARYHPLPQTVPRM